MAGETPKTLAVVETKPAVQSDTLRNLGYAFIIFFGSSVIEWFLSPETKGAFTLLIQNLTPDFFDSYVPKLYDQVANFAMLFFGAKAGMARATMGDINGLWKKKEP